MNFRMIVPEHKVKPGRLTMASRNRGGGAFRLHISMPHSMYQGALGKGEKINIAWGEGASAGKLQISSSDAGHFKPSFLKHCVMIMLPPLDVAPDFKMEPGEVEHRQTPQGMVIDMPEWAWNAERQTAIRLARNQVAKEREIAVKKSAS